MKPFQLTGRVFFIISVVLLFCFKPRISPPNPLLGKWTLAGLESKNCSNSQNNFKNTCPKNCEILTFGENGIFAFENGLGDPSSGNGTYTIVGNKVSITAKTFPPESTFKVEGKTMYFLFPLDPTTKCQFVQTFTKL